MKLGTNLFRIERSMLKRGVKLVAGVDEAGRGPLAGPVVAAAVILPDAWIKNGMPEHAAGLNDSKKLSDPQRRRFYEWLTSHPQVKYAVGMAEPLVIDSINILRATLNAMRDALISLSAAPEKVLVDGSPIVIPEFDITTLVRGDSRSYSIAAASVIAKVTRDMLMEEYDGLYPEYGFAAHKGYGTKRHLEAIKNNGPCPIHRMTFLRGRQNDQMDIPLPE
ncbi:MAG: ribonuclease HII [Verrucomicrobia bacterium]|nr:ribonuclease HII [Verrucomicrobiota bacterium]MCF7707525.1 ribonuclease HII [Verrucomicrobiota bacterium]